MKHAPGFLALVQEAKAQVTEVTVPEVQRMQGAAEPLILIDVREDHEWAVGHAIGAVHLGRGVIERDIEGRIPDKQSPIVLYCGGGFRSALSAVNLARMGYGNVRSMAGGIREWIAQGAPCVTP